MRFLNGVRSRHALPDATRAATGRQRAIQVTLLLALNVILFGCSERSPQYQMIPAILDGDIAKVESLLGDTANVHINWQAGGDGASALSAATAVNDVAITKLLLQRGADPNISTADNRRPLQSAAYHGHVEIA